MDGVLAGLSELGLRELVSPLAEGADRLVAHRALAAGWRLQALLPFPAVRYEDDFHGDGSVGEFRGLLTRASAVEVVPGAAPPSPDPDLPYRRVGLALLDRVALLVALWDGEAPRGPGGTGEVVQEAVRRGIPVVWIHSVPPHPVRLVEPGVPGAWRVAGALPTTLPRVLFRWLGTGAP